MVLSALTVVGLAVPASAAGSWFAPYVSTSIPNTFGPGPAPIGTASADFNKDGKPDIVTIKDFTMGNILFAPGKGDGTFGTTSEIDGTAQTQGLDAGDVNGDGNADVIAMTTSDVSVQLGDGTGHFSLGGKYPLALGGQVVPRLVDVDGDGDVDIVAPTFTSIQTLLNDGDGAFSTGPSSAVAGAGVLSGISPAKLNSDGKVDLFAVDGMSGTAFAMLGDGTGKFKVSGTLYGSGLVPEDIAALDLNGDGFDDVAVVGSFSFTLATALTNGSGKFVGYNATYQYGGPGPTSLTAADFNRDGKKDLAISSLATPAPTLTILSGNGTAKMAKVGDFPVGIAPQNPVVADYDGDNKLDIVTAGPGALSFLKNTTS